jgi:hypothetical protein
VLTRNDLSSTDYSANSLSHCGEGVTVEDPGGFVLLFQRSGTGLPELEEPTELLQLQGQAR